MVHPVFITERKEKSTHLVVIIRARALGAWRDMFGVGLVLGCGVGFGLRVQFCRVHSCVFDLVVDLAVALIPERYYSFAQYCTVSTASYGAVPLQRLSVKAVHPAATADPDVVYHIRETCLIVSSFLPAFLPRYTSKLEVISISGGTVDYSIGQHAGIPRFMTRN